MQRAYPQNLPVLDELLATRHELATLLGYRNWAHYSTEDKMIGNEQAVGEFIAKIAAPAKERAKADYAELLSRKRQDDPAATEVFPWESSYLISRIQAERYKADPQAARPYFEFNAVKEGLLDLTSRLFGISYRKVSKPGVWTAGVDTYDVLDAKGERVLGRIYLDLHPREGKYKHFAQFSVINGKAGERLPEGALVCNFPEPKEGAPALLEHDGVQTFFHEFGHLLHHVLGGHTEWSAISGVANEWDFVEAPSQLLEEWAWDPTVLQTFAKHHETGEPIPAELVKAMKAADEFGKGAVVARQLSFAALSLGLHDRDPAGLDTTQLMADLKEKYTPFKHVEGDFFHAAFGHLNGYSSNYYTYMWSLVIAKDLAGKFEKSGWLNPEEPRRYRTHVLEPGGSKPAAELVADFLGRPYEFAAFEKWLKA
jgi:thimet oligopeptidase